MERSKNGKEQQQQQQQQPQQQQQQQQQQLPPSNRALQRISSRASSFDSNCNPGSPFQVRRLNIIFYLSTVK